MVFHVDLYKSIPIVAMGNYYPVSSGSVDIHSRQILDFKDGKDEAVSVFSNKLITYLRGKGLGRQPVFVATIPSSTHGRSHAGFAKLIKNLSFEFSVQNPDYNLILRTKTKLAAHKGGSRRKEDALASTAIPIDIARKIGGRSVILLDDITTTTNSIKAGIDVLTDAGALVRIAVVLGRTMRR
ncbi:phosphoribosyltransferase [Agarilytica rhodophyticola]|uniref:phosphoribosyltransferase n=1 Tax=Agarilytica rhodophyticola TaxID=1737490 RepID=UPI000CD9A1B5|nr:phosphoribosyltransferase [Agarilytica rhodophyticola]